MKGPFDYFDKAAFVLVMIAGLYFGHRLFLAGKDTGAVGLLGFVTTALGGYWGQIQARAAREAALLVMPPAPEKPTEPSR